MYLNANNLYGYVMSKFLPKKGFKWINSKNFDSNKCSSNNAKGCVLEDDLVYPNYMNYIMIILWLQIK